MYYALCIISEPVFYFDKAEYTVDESSKQVQVVIRRNGTDLTKPASVTIRSRMTDPRSAEGMIRLMVFSLVKDCLLWHV